MFNQDVLQPDGSVKRIQVAKRLAPVDDLHRSKGDVRSLLDELLAPFNTGKVDVRSSMTLQQFAESDWLPSCERELRPASLHGYREVWARHLKPWLGQKRLCDLKAVDCTNLLAKLRQNGVGHRTIRYAKAVGSAIFKRAIAYSIVSSNPFRDGLLPKRQGKKPAKPCATLEDVWAALQVLKDVKARAAVAFAFFGGLVPSEIRGLEWTDYNDATLHVRRSVWRNHVGPTKTEAREAPIPIVEPLRSILAELRAADAIRHRGPILRGSRNGEPLHLDNLSRRVIAPTLKAAGVPWHGFRANRTGVSTPITSIAGDKGMAAEGLLRHSSLSTTDRHYIQVVPEDTLLAAREMERKFAEYGAKMEQFSTAPS